MAEDLGVCPLCDRPLGTLREKHHVIPKSKGGKDTVLLHPICHRKIHKTFTRAELAKMKDGIEALRADPAIEAFVKWLANKPPDFYRRTR